MVRVILGTMTMGPAVGGDHCDGSHNDLDAYCQTPPSVALEQLRALCACPAARVASGPEQGKVLVDTATAYQNWETERTLGDIFAAHPEIRSQVSLHTKVNKMQKPFKSLSKESVLYQVEGSLSRLRVEHIDILYLHGPDINTDIEDTLDGIEALYRQRKIREFGLSNFPAWKVVDVYYRCAARGTVRPTVYQGCYNAITRSIEFEAAAAFRELGIRAYHYNPLAGGMLTGKYATPADDRDGGRFGKASPISGAAYSARYWKKSVFDALHVLRAACMREGIPMAEASIRWLMHHSVLSARHHDGIIFGASTLTHAQANLAVMDQGPLPQVLVDAFDEAWILARPTAFAYFRDYGSSAGTSDTFLRKYQPVVPNSAPGL